MVHTTISAPQIPSTCTGFAAFGSAAVRTHKAVTLVLSNVLTFKESTAMKYLGGRAMVMVPPTGTAVTVSNLNEIVPVLRTPGILSEAVEKAKSSSTLIRPPKAGKFDTPFFAESVDVARLKAMEGVGGPNVTAPGMNVNSMFVQAGTAAPATVQTTVSAFGTFKTISDVPAVSLHVAVPPPTFIVLALVESTALKYLGGRAMVMVPPTGTAVAVLKPNLIGSTFAKPGLLNDAEEYPENPTIFASCPPRPGNIAAEGICLSLEVATLKPLEGGRGEPTVTAPATNLKVVDAPAANPFPAMEQTTKLAVVIPNTIDLAVGERTHDAEPPLERELTLVGSTAAKYLCGRAIVILPPMGTGVEGAKPKEIVSVFVAPGI